MASRTTSTTQHPHSPRGTLPAFTPVPRKTDRHNGWKPETQRAFIEALATTGSVTSACRAVKRSEVGAYLLRRHPEAESFRTAWQAALDLGMQRIEDVAMDRALNGVEVPVYSYGKLVGSRTVYNDRLLMFMLRNRAPERFTEGRAKGMNAIDKQQLARLKKQWRAEWEAEQQDPYGESEDAVLEQLNEKLDLMQSRMIEGMSPRTRAAWDAYCESAREDREAGYNWYEDPDHPNYTGGKTETPSGPTLPAPWQPPEETEEDEPGPGPRRFGLKDGWWE